METQNDPKDTNASIDTDDLTDINDLTDKHDSINTNASIDTNDPTDTNASIDTNDLTYSKRLQHTRKSGENISENGMLISVMLVPENWCRISSFHLISRFKKKN